MVVVMIVIFNTIIIYKYNKFSLLTTISLNRENLL